MTLGVTEIARAKMMAVRWTLGPEKQHARDLGAPVPNWSQRTGSPDGFPRMLMAYKLHKQATGMGEKCFQVQWALHTQKHPGLTLWGLVGTARTTTL